MSGVNGQPVVQIDEPFEGAEQQGSVSAGQVAATDAAGEEGIAREQKALQIVAKEVADAARAVPRRVDDLDGHGPDGEDIAVAEGPLGGTAATVGTHPSGEVSLGVDEGGGVLVVKGHAQTGLFPKSLEAEKMIGVAVRQEDDFKIEAPVGEETQDLTGVAAGIDEEGPAPSVPYQIAVGPERTEGKALHLHDGHLAGVSTTSVTGPSLTSSTFMWA